MGEMIPCKIIELTDSISKAKISDVDKRCNALEVSQKAEKNERATPIKEDVNSSPSRREQNLVVVENISQERNPIVKSTKKENIIIKGLRNVGEFVVEHPVEFLELGLAITGVVKEVSAHKSKRHCERNINSTNSNTNSVSPARSDIVTQVSDIVEKAKRSSPNEHTVASHKQHYHTKNGLILKEKNAYPRGGKKIRHTKRLTNRAKINSEKFCL